jgi:hypothetical protein
MGFRDLLLINLYIFILSIDFSDFLNLGLQFPGGNNLNMSNSSSGSTLELNTVDFVADPNDVTSLPLPPPAHGPCCHRLPVGLAEWIVFTFMYLLGLQFSFFVRWLYVKAKSKGKGSKLRMNSFHGGQSRNRGHAAADAVEAVTPRSVRKSVVAAVERMSLAIKGAPPAKGHGHGHGHSASAGKKSHGDGPSTGYAGAGAGAGAGSSHISSSAALQSKKRPSALGLVVVVESERMVRSPMTDNVTLELPAILASPSESASKLKSESASASASGAVHVRKSTPAGRVKEGHEMTRDGAGTGSRSVPTRTKSHSHADHPNRHKHRQRTNRSHKSSPAKPTTGTKKAGKQKQLSKHARSGSALNANTMGDGLDGLASCCYPIGPMLARAIRR